MIRELVDRIANDCLKVSGEANASPGAGANDIGVPENEMKELEASRGCNCKNLHL
jgi:hypothetical protein